jgi:hypothetical protein
VNGLPTVDEYGMRRLGESLACDAFHVLPLLQSLLPTAVTNVIDMVRWEGWPCRLARLDAIRARWKTEDRESFSEALFCRTKRGESAREFSDLAIVIGVMAFTPGGVKAFGLHWEEKDDDRSGMAGQY